MRHYALENLYVVVLWSSGAHTLVAVLCSLALLDLVVSVSAGALDPKKGVPQRWSVVLGCILSIPC